MISFPEIPANSVLGLNYSGMHDSAIAIVGPDGKPVFACSLERISRVKQDGRRPLALLEGLPWDRIARVALSTNESFDFPLTNESRLLQVRLPSIRSEGLRHEQAFYEFLQWIPAEKEFVCHQMSHAASAFWASGFDAALCMTYDGGMYNSPWFGGLYMCSREKGIEPLDQFSALHYAKITSLYTFVTALLGFTPNKHEGKITGLAAFGKPTDACRALLKHWFDTDFFAIESTMEWINVYGPDQIPAMNVRPAKMQPFRDAVQRFSREELAATVQEMAETHVLEILNRAKDLGWSHANMCLAGGLFANVKINQKVVESGFQQLFVAPPMTDDGTALGAAWQMLAKEPKFSPAKLKSMYLGPAYAQPEVERLLNGERIQFERLSDPAKHIADLLAEDQVVAVFQGAMEFGPRSLGNRSILAQATRSDINQSLNQRLNRTEFMPFAPVTRAEDAESCYLNIGRVAHSAEFMTVTVDCTAMMKDACPAVVHVDGTARPQLVSHDSNPFIHAVLTNYVGKTRRPALVNTSFNIHEEPIVCTPEDAIQGFFESGLDYLYIEGGYLISFRDNANASVRYLQEKLKKPAHKLSQQAAVIAMLDARLARCDVQLIEKERVIQDLLAGHGKSGSNTDVQLLEKEKEKEKAIEGLMAENKKLHEDIAQYVKTLISQQAAVIAMLDARLERCDAQWFEKERVIQDLLAGCGKSDSNTDVQLLEKERTIEGLQAENKKLHEDIAQYVKALKAYRSAYGGIVQRYTLAPLVRMARRLFARMTKRLFTIFRPRLGWLSQYAPRSQARSANAGQRALPTYPCISIVTPSYQQGGYIERTIRSVLDQSYPNLQYYVQDGGSTDSTVETLKRYEGKLSGWVSERDSGQSQAINLGFAHTDGEIMAWLNSDDLLLPGALHSVADYFNRNPDIDVVYGNRLLVDVNDMEIGRWILPGHDNTVLSWADYVPQETMFWRRSIWEKVGGKIDESFRFAMDWDLLVRFRDAGARFGHIPRFMGAFRIHEHQKTSAAINEVGYQEMNRIRERVFGRLPTHDEIRSAIFPFLFKHIVIDIIYRVRTRLSV